MSSCRYRYQRHHREYQGRQSQEALLQLLMFLQLLVILQLLVLLQLLVVVQQFMHHLHRRNRDHLS
jgi:hypothetical protein